VEKFDFLHKINRLRDFEAAGQSLYLVCTEVGQKIRTPDPGRFFTSRPVDIHQLVHSRARC
jgi:hypothetical protein